MAVSEQREQQENQSNRGSDSMDNQQEISRMNNESTSNERSGNGNGRQGSNRGFAAMSPEKQKEIASEGGRAAHQQGVAHEWNSEEARMAGRKGGQSVSQNREHMSEIGRRGGQSSGGRRRNKQNGNES